MWNHGCICFLFFLIVHVIVRLYLSVSGFLVRQEDPVLLAPETKEQKPGIAAIKVPVSRALYFHSISTIELIEIAFILCLALTFGSCFKTEETRTVKIEGTCPSLLPVWEEKKFTLKIVIEIDLFCISVSVHPTKYVSISSVLCLLYQDTNQMQTKNFHVISFL